MKLLLTSGSPKVELRIPDCAWVNIAQFVQVIDGEYRSAARIEVDRVTAVRPSQVAL